MEAAHHNKVVEDMDQRRLALKEKKFKSLSWQGKNDQLNYKMNLLSKYAELKQNYNWTNKQILCFYPEMAKVINAQQQPPMTQDSKVSIINMISD
jgi:hypothetical protein